MLSHVVVKDTYIGVDDLNIEKWRSVLQTCFLTLPDHLSVAQSLLDALQVWDSAAFYHAGFKVDH
jgi:hypothetical protein